MQLGQHKITTPFDSLLEKIRTGEPATAGRMHFWPGVMIILVATLIAYTPVFSAGFIWDDDDYVINNQLLTDAHGLREIWFNPTATPQYYPLVFTTFWVECHLWGLHAPGFHAVNVLLHVLVALLFWRVLVRLNLPGAWLAAAIFALHPMEVESVAWVTELKNVLSTVFYFLAALAYLQFTGMEDDPPAIHRWRYYTAALVLFVAALWSKTVTCSLPAALLVVLWWKKGRLGWRDVLPLAPFFAIGLGLGLTTAWLEKSHVGATGPEWALTFIDRCLIAGRAVCFYAGHLVLPARLTFIYPRWTIDPQIWWQWIFPLAAAGALSALWLARDRIGRGPLAAALFFAITLAPAIGFINVYPMRFSFVADHFQYLAGAGLIALVATRLAALPRAFNALLLLVCGLLTLHQCGSYHDLETLWRDTLDKNPACWMAHTNLGRLLVQQQKFDEAETHYQAALKTDPNVAEIHYNYGNLLARTGRFNAAIAEYEESIRLNPAMADVHNNLGATLLREHRAAEAMTQYRQAVMLSPRNMSFHYNLGSAMVAQHLTNDAIAEFQRALQLEPDSDLVKRRLRELGAAVH